LQADFNQQVDMIDVTRWGDPEPVMLPGRTETRGNFRFLLSEDELRRQDALFQVGEGAFASHYLGPSDVCEYCGTAWLPGTFSCPSCGAPTNHFTQAIEYRADNTGMVTSKTLNYDPLGLLTLEVEVFFASFTVSGTDFFACFEHSLWGNTPALWVCRFCGYVVMGHKSSCPGCGGNRIPIKELATQQRSCIYCGRESLGNYACTHCNTRLMAGPRRAL
jgi:hypothetical protein